MTKQTKAIPKFTNEAQERTYWDPTTKTMAPPMSATRDLPNEIRMA